MLNAQIAFANDVLNFITNHPYYKQTEGILSSPSLPFSDINPITITLTDPDGDYEELQIKLVLKP